ncbi:MAG TPA: phosphate acyltransferase, partial [Pyrinomonadaceae bacterium]|nr:phosphate acyltransferase [Pyrinomonadaceae bacterium]
MDILDRIRQRAASRPQHILLPEGNDPRTVVAAAHCVNQRIARITLLGEEETIRGHARDNNLDLGGVAIINHRRAGDFEKMVALLHELRRAKGLMADEARTLVS